MSYHKTSLPGILVVDDDEMMREVLSAILSAEGYAVQTAASGEEALTWLAATHDAPGVLLVDVQMPGLEGGELAARLNELRAPQTPLIGMSGSRPKPGVRSLFDVFLHKPFGLEAFREAVERAMQARTAAMPTETSTAETNDARNPLDKALPPAALDEALYARLAAMVPAAQLDELYRISLEDVLRRVELMRTAAAAGDFEQCRREAHAIKGGCGMVGATELSELAAHVEEGSFDGTPPLDDFTAACSRLRRMLDARS